MIDHEDLVEAFRVTILAASRTKFLADIGEEIGICREGFNQFGDMLEELSPLPDANESALNIFMEVQNINILMGVQNILMGVLIGVQVGAKQLASIEGQSNLPASIEVCDN